MIVFTNILWYLLIILAFTNNDGVVVGDEHLAVDVDELGHQFSLQISVSPQTGDGDVVYPLISHWNKNRRYNWEKRRILFCEGMNSTRFDLYFEKTVKNLYIIQTE